MSTLNKSDIDKIANLAKLNISESENQLLGQNLNEILKLVDKMNQIDTSHIEPLAHSSSETQLFREDIVTESNQRTLFQKNAPQVEAGLYMVPVVIENEE
ncbi:Asp-tRNA(Asn)/Glu-tRNA(Gln) amidotransferase GatCAB subunit C [Coxiella-like endosymbiont of Rhipicephalus sanguineus]|uniref:Asp-tRNA(Asn)/Glu-tRNA(Gln) amidotransferase subunit GatC n=1 Tax=Coxiella-like endosymbiont of Rhipicephalus sanguineus TaxID=1955402 RepID=UPI00203ADA5E|nr:Asp-tRNA(Asn)/Glu-tRNA(Gln) amidotransferase subunit GatC [Coxiella-like endosymbiont of Rhipicephalus sanguineus]MBT8506358.1 Asp-tRNA(Asn)/Glu-tRNA(Gln) amidotransferase GatCAB subunit C [Coxiella-like endosymbiont of Rhipicephalus sanguineus]